jgi:hypothetical protein
MGRKSRAGPPLTKDTLLFSFFRQGQYGSGSYAGEWVPGAGAA